MHGGSMGGCPATWGARASYLACGRGDVLLTLLMTLAYSLRALRSPILVVSSLLLGSWYSSCSPGTTKPWAACGGRLQGLRRPGRHRLPAGGGSHSPRPWPRGLAGYRPRAPPLPATFPEAEVAVSTLDLTPLELVVLAPAVLHALPALALAVGADSVGPGADLSLGPLDLGGMGLPGRGPGDLR